MRYARILIARIGLFGQARVPVPADVFDNRLTRLGLREARRGATRAALFRN